MDKENLVKNEEKRIMAPPTFTDRFDMVQNNLAKKEDTKNEISPGLNKSINIVYKIKTPEDMNVKRGSTSFNTRSLNLKSDQHQHR